MIDLSAILIEVVTAQIYFFLISALQYFVNSYFGRGNGSVLLDELSCSGHEKTLDNCGSSGWYISDCDHTEDAGVACESKLTEFSSSNTFTIHFWWSQIECTYTSVV